MQFRNSFLIILSVVISSFVFLLSNTPSAYSQEEQMPGKIPGSSNLYICGDGICNDGETCSLDCSSTNLNCQSCGNRGYVCTSGGYSFCSETNFTGRGYSCTACVVDTTPTPTPTLAPQSTGMTISGVAMLNGTVAPTGTVINALINGKICGTTTVPAPTGRGGSAFNMLIKSSNEETGCGTNGLTINYTVGNVPASTTTIFYSGSTQYVSISAQGTSNTPTPTTPIDTCPLKNNGDANCDGTVDLLDFNLWRDYFIAGGPNDQQTLSQVDFNSDGTIDLLDFNIWKDGFSNGVRTLTPTLVVDTICQSCKDQGLAFKCDRPGTDIAPICATEANSTALSSQRGGGYTCTRCY